MTIDDLQPKDTDGNIDATLKPYLELEYYQRKTDWNYFGKPDQNTMMHQYEKVEA